MEIFLIVIGILLLANLVFLIFILNYNSGFVILGLASVLLIIYAIFINSLSINTHILIGIICSIALVFTIFLAIYGNLNNATYDEDVVIVLGAGIRGERVTVNLARRLDATVEYHKKNSNAIIVVCGSQGPQEHITEALAMERYLITKGTPQEKIVKEERSHSTFENLSFASKILKERFPNEFSGVLITNDFHIYRSIKLARIAGISLNHIGAKTDWYTIPLNYLREMVAVCGIWISPSAR